MTGYTEGEIAGAVYGHFKHPAEVVGRVEELEALPIGTVIVGPSGISAQRGELGWWLSAVTQCETPLKSRAYAQNVGLPATVLTPATTRDVGALPPAKWEGEEPIPRYALRDLWEAVYGKPPTPHLEASIDAHGEAKVWAALLDAVKIQGTFS